jgi:hypothetical protein
MARKDLKTKQVKLQPKTRYLAFSQKNVPWLNVSGIWLEQAGFKVGGQVEITVEQNQLIIKAL